MKNLMGLYTEGKQWVMLGLVFAHTHACMHQDHLGLQSAICDSGQCLQIRAKMVYLRNQASCKDSQTDEGKMV